MTVIARLQSNLDVIVWEVRQRHPELTVVDWSHSIGEATDLDGWSMGFTIAGPVEPIEFEVSLTAIHSKPRQIKAQARWRSKSIFPVIWDDWEHQVKSQEPGERSEITELDGLLDALLEAIAKGPEHRKGSSILAFLFNHTVDHLFPEPELRESLRPDEVEVYQAWFAYLREQNVHPIRLTAGGPRANYHPHSPSQRESLARLIQPPMPHMEALIGALFAPEQVPAHLQGPGLEVVTEPDDIPGREFYARHPRGHGHMGLSAIGFKEDEAAFFISNQDGGFFPDQGPVGETVTRLGDGGFLAVLERQGGRWRMKRLSRLPWNWVRRTMLEGELFLHFSSRAQLYVLDRDLRNNALRLHIRLEPHIGQPLEVHVIERSYLWNEGDLALDCPCPVVVFPYLHRSVEVIVELERLIAEL